MEQFVAPSFTVEQINEAIEAMAKAQAGAVKSIAKVIVMAAWAANQEVGDATVANSLMANLRKGIKKDAIVSVLEAFCNLAYASGRFVSYAAGHGWTEEEVKAIKVAAASWETFKKAPAPVARVDVIVALAELVEKLTTKAKKEQLDHADKLQEIRALLGAMQGEALFE